MMMIWLISFKSDLSLKARLVVNGKMCIDYDPDETYCGNVAATSTKIFFALSALYGLTLLNNGTPDCKKIYCIQHTLDIRGTYIRGTRDIPGIFAFILAAR